MKSRTTLPDMEESEPISADEVLRAIPALACHARTLEGRALGPPVIHALPAQAVAGLLDHLGSSSNWNMTEALRQALALLRCPSSTISGRIDTQVTSLLRDWPTAESQPTGTLYALAARSGGLSCPDMGLPWGGPLHFGVRVALTAERDLDQS